MISYGDDEYPSDDDEQYYKDTAYNEDYYIEQEQETIRQSNLELELERLEDETLREMREEGLLRPTLVKPGESELKTYVPAPANSSDSGDLPF